MKIQDLNSILDIQPLNYDRNVDGDLFGIEIEVENCDQYFPKNGYWEIGFDGSLRNHGAEFRFKRPFNLVDAKAALSLFYNFASKTVWDFSVRCGTHIHIDLRDLEVDQISYFVESYIMVEPVLIHTLPCRASNTFCASLNERILNMQEFSRMIKNPNMAISTYKHTFNKYGSLNLRNLNTLGTAEFRMLPASCSKTDILSAMYLLSDIKTLALENRSIDKNHFGSLFNDDTATMVLEGMKTLFVIQRLEGIW